VLAPLALAAVVWAGGLVHAWAEDGLPAPRPLAPLGTPAAAPAGEGGFAFLLPRPDGRPTAFDPCQPVHWVLRTAGEPPGGRAVVEQAFAEVSRATGLQFVFDGTTGEAPSPDRPRRQPERYGDRWAPVLVAWATEAEAPELEGAQVGSGIASWADEGLPRIVSGQLLLDREDLTTSDGRLGRLAAGTALHELAHVVGLGHVEDSEQLMHPLLLGREGFGDGDLRGLHELGRGPCAPPR
jgi:hypothetical protein